MTIITCGPYYRSGGGLQACQQDGVSEAVPDGEVRVEMEAVRPVTVREPLPTPAQTGPQQLAATGKHPTKACWDVGKQKGQ